MIKDLNDELAEHICSSKPALNLNPVDFHHLSNPAAASRNELASFLKTLPPLPTAPQYNALGILKHRLLLLENFYAEIAPSKASDAENAQLHDKVDILVKQQKLKVKEFRNILMSRNELPVNILEGIFRFHQEKKASHAKGGQ